ncbi:MAG: 1-acyl-sn-glycerol-3-phosphate acyltransferase, partial [Verrucomicrobiota bacterium]|nr:1-acyl-sn-glycerol-3-phosphate acyltransferase [Verrucomicrobiota bacterium]
LSFAGLGAAFFLVPINAFQQDECDPDQPGKNLAGSAQLNCQAKAGAVILQFVMQEVLSLTSSNQFLILALVSVGATWYVMRLLPRAFVKMLAFSGLRAFYRIESIHTDRMPKEGGVLLTPNHVSYLDALILTAASPRPVRFLMVSDYFDKPLVGKVARLFDTVPISSKRAKDAIQVAAEAVKEGSVVCIFPEGELTRSGFMGEFKRGMELIARKADCLVQPVYLDGLWKSIFSAERGKYFWKMPRAIPFGVRVAFGEAWAAKDYRAGDVSRELNSLAGEVFARRRESAGRVKDFLRQQVRPGNRALRWVNGGQVCSCNWEEVQGLLEQEGDCSALAQGHPGAQQWLEDWRVLDGLDEEEWRGLLLNAQQLADPYNLGDGKAAVTLDSSAPPAVRRVWGLLLPAITGVETVVLGPDEGVSELKLLAREKVALRDMVGTPRMREVRRDAEVAGVALVLYLFEGGSQKAGDADSGVFAAYESGGRVLSFSMPPDPVIFKGDKAHPGWKEHSCGRLLPGFVVKGGEEGVEVSGEMLSGSITLRDWSVDERGFLSQSRPS